MIFLQRIQIKKKKEKNVCGQGWGGGGGGVDGRTYEQAQFHLLLQLLRSGGHNNE